MGGKCGECGSRLSYCEEHDAKYCIECNEWREIQCGAADCEYCNTRPELPSEVAA